MRNSILVLALVLIPVLAVAGPPDAVKVFILAGQSNMEGKGAVNTLAHLGDDAEYGHLLADIYKDGEWVVRDDVFIDYLGRSGPLTVGFGSKGGAHGGKIGPELAIGTVLGDAFDEKILLIKTAWGGKDVAKDFLPPSMGGPGEFYTKMMENVDRVLADIGSVVPGYKDEGYEICGFIWFQGWNDQFTEDWYTNYGEYMAAFISDVREDLEAPDMKFVIGQVGFDGLRKSRPARNGGLSARDHIKKGQLAMAKRGGLEGAVAVVRTDQYWDVEADAIYNGEGGWSKDVDKWHQFGNDRPYHYLGSAIWFSRMGTAFGKAMRTLIEE